MIIVKLLSTEVETFLEFVNVLLSTIAVGYCLVILAIAQGVLARIFRYLVAGICTWGLAELIEGFALVGLLKIGAAKTHDIYHGIQLIAFIFILGSLLQLYRLGAKLREEGK